MHILKIEEKTLNTQPIDGIVTQGESNAEKCTIVFDSLNYGNIKLSELSWQMRGVSKDYETLVVQSLTAVVIDNKISLIWVISKDFTAVAGHIILTLVGISPDGEDVIKYTSKGMRVNATYNAVNPPSKDVFEQMLVEMQKKLSRCENILKEISQLQNNPAYIGENGNWFLFDDTIKQYVDSKKPSKGEDGKKGDKGDEGIKGDKGEKGEKGVDGIDGQNGKDFIVRGKFNTLTQLRTARPFPEMGEAWFIGVEDVNPVYIYDTNINDWSTIGPIQGPEGKMGPRGADGKQGIKGETGLTGADGNQGIQGIQGVPGVKGNRGEQGVQGVAGQGVVSGGTIGQVLAKKTGTSFDTQWKTLTATDVGAATVAAVEAVKATANSAQATANAAMPKATYESYNNMSTVEHFTGKYDLNGRKVYEKSLILNLTVTGVSQASWGISNFDNLIAADCAVKTNENSYRDMPLVGNNNQVLATVNYPYDPNGLFSFHTIGLNFAKTVLATIQYTCTDR